MTSKQPIVISVIDCLASFLLSVATPKARLTMGFINGAMIIAPITAAALLSISPTVAMIVAMINKTKNSRLGFAAFSLDFKTASCSLSPLGLMNQLFAFLMIVVG